MHSIATNQQVADAIGVDVSMASRLRSGDRHPSVTLMLRIQNELGWTIGRQARAMLDGKFGKAFEEVLCEKFGTS